MCKCCSKILGLSPDGLPLFLFSLQFWPPPLATISKCMHIYYEEYLIIPYLFYFFFFYLAISCMWCPGDTIDCVSVRQPLFASLHHPAQDCIARLTKLGGTDVAVIRRSINSKCYQQLFPVIFAIKHDISSFGLTQPLSTYSTMFHYSCSK